MEFKGTKGEWHACCKSNMPHFLFAGEGETVLCSFFSKQDDGTELPLEEIQSNAKLIETAPELLKALTELIELKQMKFNDGEYTSDEYLKRKPLAWENAQLVINKALGI